MLTKKRKQKARKPQYKKLTIAFKDAKEFDSIVQAAEEDERPTASWARRILLAEIERLRAIKKGH